MAEKSYLQLKTTCILNIPIESYDLFTFVVNGKEFQTSRLISDLLSPKICRIHSIDPTIDRFFVNTKNAGDFGHILELVNFKRKEITEDETLFICEILDSLGNDSIEIFIPEDKDKLTVENSIDILKKHLKYSTFYNKNISTDIEFISTNFGEILDNQELKVNIKTIDISIIERIINNEHLRIQDEDQLLKFVNELYKENSKYFTLYEFVLFCNVSSEIINEFIKIYDISDMTTETWKSISLRLKQNVIKNDNDKDEHKERYHINYLDFKFENNKEFEGIIHHLIKETNGQIENEMKLTSSSTSVGSGQLNYVFTSKITE